MDLPQAPINKKGPRSSVSAEAFGTWNQQKEFTPKVFSKSEEQKNRIVDKLNKAFMFSGLDDTELDIVIGAM